MKTVMEMKWIIASIVVVGLLALAGGSVSLTQAEGPVPKGGITVKAPVGPSFVYQGRLDKDGSPVNGNADFWIRLYDAETGGGTIPGTSDEQKYNVPVVDGLFSVELNFGADVFNGQGRWLEIGVGFPAGSYSYDWLTSRQPILAVPYALYALNAPASSSSSSGWDLEGNAGTNAATNFLGTTDDTVLTLKVNNEAALRIMPNPGSPNLVGGFGGIWLGRSNVDYHTPVIGASTFLNTSTGAKLTDGGVWTNASDRNAKENFVPANGRDILKRLLGIPTQTWNYKAEQPSIRHIGPVAQDFFTAFAVGQYDTHIGTIDADGVALAAIQGLYEEIQERDARISQLEAQNASLEARLTALEKAVAQLAK